MKVGVKEDSQDTVWDITQELVRAYVAYGKARDRCSLLSVQANAAYIDEQHALEHLERTRERLGRALDERQ